MEEYEDIGEAEVVVGPAFAFSVESHDDELLAGLDGNELGQKRSI